MRDFHLFCHVVIYLDITDIGPRHWSQTLVPNHGNRTWKISLREGLKLLFETGLRESLLAGSRKHPLPEEAGQGEILYLLFRQILEKIRAIPAAPFHL